MTTWTRLLWWTLCLLVPAVPGQTSQPTTDRAENEVTAHSAWIGTLAQQAYIKASNTGDRDHFGARVAICGDTMVVGAPVEFSSATGVNGDQADNSAEWAGAAYVFVRDGDSWTQQAYLKPSNTEEGDGFGSSVAISGDTLVVGAPFEDSAAVGVDGDQSDNSASAAGAAYVFVRNGTTWSQQAYIKASNTEAADQFGFFLGISGDTIAVSAHSEDSAAIGVDGDGDDNSASFSGAAYVFVREGTTWSQQAYLKASNTDEGDRFGWKIDVSGDTVVVGASRERSSATGVDGNQSDNSALAAGAAYVFVRTGSTWSQQAYLKASNARASQGFGVAVAVDGDTVVVGAPGEQSNATGVNGDESDESAPVAGAAYVFTRSGSVWSQQAYVKASNTEPDEQFGWGVDISGDLMAISAVDEDSGTTGVDGDQLDNSSPDSGAVYVFARNDDEWFQQAYVKASNTDAGDQLSRVAVSGSTVVAASLEERSSATGINGDQADNSLFRAGAAYVFVLEPWVDLGGGTTSALSAPELELTGPLTPGSEVTLQLVDGPPSSLALIFVSFTSTPTPFLGGTLHAFPFDELVVFGTNGAGQIHGSTGFPGGPSGQGLWFQVAIEDPSALPFGAVLSNAVRGSVP